MTEMNAIMMENANDDQTARFAMVEQLAGKMSIPLAEAKAALDAADWNTLTATHLLEREAFLRKQALEDAVENCVDSDDKTARNDTAVQKAAARPRKSGRWFSNLRDHLRRLAAYGNRNRFTVSKDGGRLLEMPVTALALLLLFSFGTCALLMAVGLFAGCRYAITAVAEA